MAVPIWMVFGIILVLLALPFWLVASGAGGFALGAGVAFLVVALSNWVRERWGTAQDAPDPELA
jgi:preprotein translocase subunit Sec63